MPIEFLLNSDFKDLEELGLRSVLRFMPVQSYNRYSDILARKKRRRFFIWLLTVILVLISLFTFAGYIVFYSSKLDVKEISISGIDTLERDQILQIIHSEINGSFLPIFNLHLKKNYYLFDTESAKNLVTVSFPVVKSVEVKKEFPDKIFVNVVERSPLGTWCEKESDLTKLLRQDSEQVTISCRYFDEDGVLWGKAVKSSGSLLLVIENLNDKVKISAKLVAMIRKSIDSLRKLNIETRSIKITEESADYFVVKTNHDYNILFSIETSIDKQIKVLDIFLDNQEKEFQPAEYIDLRIEGRVYYK